MIPSAQVWLIWSSAFLLPWGLLYWRFPTQRRAMIWASLFTTPFGLTEPLFVPRYWNPPSLFDLAQRTGFDIESLIFCFGIGGVGAVLVNILTRRRAAPIGDAQRHHPRHRLHRVLLAIPFVLFPLLLGVTGWNPIYPAVVAMGVGGALTVWCRPDLARSTALGGLVFLLYYLVFLSGLELSAPKGYIQQVWNLEDLSGFMLGFIPLEELLFATAFGAYWAGVYEHYTWQAPETTSSNPRLDDPVREKESPLDPAKWSFWLLLFGAAPLAAQDPSHHPATDTVPARRTPGQMEMEMPARPLGTPMSREGSGTSWLPDSTPVHAVHRMAGPWMLMLHGNAFLQYIHDGGPRGSSQFGSAHWVMGMASRSLGGGSLGFRLMLSAEPLTVGECGYPNLLATGETCRGELLHDRQHPHDLFMELAGTFEREVSPSLAVQLYAGAVGEPALGPVAYPHRLSAMSSPIAPIVHHWLDATHITFGVLTAGVYGRAWKLEGSLFNGREPDEQRYDFDFDALDSYSGRLWVVPDPRLTFQISAGRLNEVELDRESGGRRDQTRLTASATYHAPWGASRAWATTAAWGHNREADHRTNVVLLESSLDLAPRHTVFLRTELAEKSGEDLVTTDPALHERVFTVGTVSAGYLFLLQSLGSFAPAVGVRGSLNLVPADLRPDYGSRSQVGFAVFGTVQIRATRMAGGQGHHQP